MSDLISREEAIEAIQNAYCKPCKERGDDHNEVRCRACDYDNAIIQIDALPSADAETKCIAQIKVDTEEVARRIKEEYDITDGWIPCSERLPEKEELVLVTVWYDVVIAWRNRYGGWESVEDMYEKGDVIAWMPLPKPWKGADDGEDI